MTKQIRIENADMNLDMNVIVEVWDKRQDGSPDIKVFEEVLSYPTAMTTSQVYLTSTRYVVVRELPR